MHMDYSSNKIRSFRIVDRVAVNRTSTLKRRFVLVALGALIALSGCSVWESLNKTEKGAVIGTGGGALIGGAAGNGAGAVVGGVAGGVAGGLVGHELGKRDRKE